MTFGKVMGGGFPAAAFGGRADVMSRLAPEGPVYQAGTLSGNPIATTAGLATLRLATDEVYAHIGAAADTIKTAASDALTRGRRRPRRPGDRHDVLGLLHRRRGAVRDFDGRLAHRRRGVRRLLPRHARPRASTCRRRRTRRGSCPPPTTTAPCRPCSTPCPTPPAPLPPPRRRRPTPMSQTPDTDRPPAAPRRGAQPRGRPLRPPRRLPPLRARQPDGRADRRDASATATSCTCGSRRWSGPRRPRAPLAAARGLEIVTDERVIESANKLRGPAASAQGALVDHQAARHLAAPLQPVQAVVGRAATRRSWPG